MISGRKGGWGFFFIVVLCVLVALVIMKIWNYFPIVEPEVDTTTEISIGNETLYVELVSSPETLKRGLSGKASLPPNTGMLFKFEQGVQPMMWMKDMNFSLDFLWLDPNGKVVGITANISPATYPQTYTSPTLASDVLEVNAGWAEEHRIKVGDQMRYRSQP